MLLGVSGPGCQVGVPSRSSHLHVPVEHAFILPTRPQGYLVLAVEHNDGSASAVRLPGGEWRLYGGLGDEEAQVRASICCGCEAVWHGGRVAAGTFADGVLGNEKALVCTLLRVVQAMGAAGWSSMLGRTRRLYGGLGGGDAQVSVCTRLHACCVCCAPVWHARAVLAFLPPHGFARNCWFTTASPRGH